MGLALSISLVLALILNNENNFVIVKLTILMWCGLAIINRQIIYGCLLINHLHGKGDLI